MPTLFPSFSPQRGRDAARWLGFAAFIVLASAACGPAAADGLQSAEHSPTVAPPTSAPANIQRPGPTTAPTSPASGDEGDWTVVAHVIEPTIAARVEPAAESEIVATFDHPTRVGGPLVFQAVGAAEEGWIEVLLPIRPNGTTGWIPVDEVELTRNPYRIEIDLDGYELRVLRAGEVELLTPIAVGLGDTPTPIGDFYLLELLKPPSPDGVYGPYAYGLSAFSDVLFDFAGGDGVIGIHGTNQPHLLGGPASHGCIRIHNDVIEELATFLPLGTPVSIG